MKKDPNGLYIIKAKRKDLYYSKKYGMTKDIQQASVYNGLESANRALIKVQQFRNNPLFVIEVEYYEDEE